ncbi:hypothetical protein DPMN_073756 [Dreissena polymorpha]|uniref:Uncharacterized protein n=1 Tax=Dreissena polymorpha TaxID=45954 RepID=A0A9D4HBK6_DREPO|nr:hypothetical protein DPMN_073756 [Dreissena polymorpha]
MEMFEVYKRVCCSKQYFDITKPRASLFRAMVLRESFVFLELGIVLQWRPMAMCEIHKRVCCSTPELYIAKPKARKQRLYNSIGYTDSP